MNPTKALYVDWHLPKKIQGKISPSKRPWEIAMIIRTLYFSRKMNALSPILYCDLDTYDYYDSIDLLKHFDEVYPILPSDISFSEFNPSVFWAAGKFLAIQHCRENFLMIDLDAEIRFKLDLDGYDVFCAHQEEVSKDDVWFYPPPEYLDSKNYLGKKYDISWSDMAYNTSILGFKNLAEAKEYANSALDFIRNLNSINPAFENVAYILLAEQRFLYEYCKAKNLNVGLLIKGKYIPTGTRRGISPFLESDLDEVAEKGFLHVWGFKSEMAKNKEVEDSFFGSLMSSRLSLRDDIVNSVSRNYDLFNNTKRS
jgi:hypothetical protein